MCCCCAGAGGRGRWREHGRHHGHHHGYEHHHHGDEHHHHGDEHHHHEGSHGWGPDGPPDRDRPDGPPDRDRGGWGRGDGRERGDDGGRFNWNESYPFGFRRQFHARGEEVELLRRYLEGLEQEAAAVREAIARLRPPPAAPGAPSPERPAAGGDVGADEAPPAGGAPPPDAAPAP
jgi:hypothetical protein